MTGSGKKGKKYNGKYTEPEIIKSIRLTEQQAKVWNSNSIRDFLDGLKPKKEDKINLSIEKIKNNWSKNCGEARKTLKNKDYKNLQYIDMLIVKGLDNDAINTRLERYRKIRITDKSLNKKREEFNKRMNKPTKRIDLNKWGNHLKLHHFIKELVDNPYYDQVWVWCNECNRRHNINSNIAGEHNIKPIPVKCKSNEDHCWKPIYDKDDYLIKYFSGIDMVLSASKNILLSLIDAYAHECIVCGKKGLKSGITILPYKCLNEETERKQYKQLTTTQFKKIYKFLQSIKDLGFEKLNKITGNQFKGNDIWFKNIEYNLELRKIQHIEDYYII